MNFFQALSSYFRNVLISKEGLLDLNFGMSV